LLCLGDNHIEDADFVLEVVFCEQIFTFVTGKFRTYGMFARKKKEGTHNNKLFYMSRDDVKHCAAHRPVWLFITP
jgi:hypothetical protein